MAINIAHRSKTMSYTYFNSAIKTFKESHGFEVVRFVWIICPDGASAIDRLALLKDNLTPEAQSLVALKARELLEEYFPGIDEMLIDQGTRSIPREFVECLAKFA
jgi:hypothetical protein